VDKAFEEMGTSLRSGGELGRHISLLVTLLCQLRQLIALKHVSDVASSGCPHAFERKVIEWMHLLELVTHPSENN
jgi:hypothetical protein